MSANAHCAMCSSIILKHHQQPLQQDNNNNQWASLFADTSIRSSHSNSPIPQQTFISVVKAFNFVFRTRLLVCFNLYLNFSNWCAFFLKKKTEDENRNNINGPGCMYKYSVEVTLSTHNTVEWYKDDVCMYMWCSGVLCLANLYRNHKRRGLSVQCKCSRVWLAMCVWVCTVCVISNIRGAMTVVETDLAPIMCLHGKGSSLLCVCVCVWEQMYCTWVCCQDWPL